jgi:branched-chain amino acid transport system substrate-binding protein
VHDAIRLAALALAAAVVCLTACTGSTTGGPAVTIKIGVDLPLSGNDGQVGLPTLNGVLFYVHQHPTIDGFQVVVSAKDDAVGGMQDSQLGARNVAALIADPQVLGVVGPISSSIARAEIPIANTAGLAMVSPASGNPCLTKQVFLPAALSPVHAAISCKDAGVPAAAELRPSGVNNFFRLGASDDLQGPAAADFGYKTLHLLRMAVVSDHEVYGQSQAYGFISRYQKLGGSVVAQLDLDPAANPDVPSFLKRAKADGAQGIYFGGVTANQGCAIRSQMTGVFDAGEKTPYLGGDGIAEDPACVRDAGANAIGIYATVAAAYADQLASAQPAITAFRAAYLNADDYGAYTMAAYDATGLLYSAFHRAITAAGGKAPARSSIVAELGATTAFSGATGTFGFDSAGDTTRRLISVFEPAGAAPNEGWTWVGAVDYTAALPY